jgi:quercetin dioxygenase-like cupin family protein
MRRPTTMSVAWLMLVSASAAAVVATAASRHEGSSQPLAISRHGSQPARSGPAQNFTGAVRIDPLFDAKEPSRTSGAYVTFEPRARTAWHTHPLGQTLIVTAGAGRVQRWGDPVEAIRPGDVVSIPPGQKHWHGASPTTALTHIAIQETTGGTNVQWMEQVTDKQYGK